MMRELPVVRYLTPFDTLAIGVFLGFGLGVTVTTLDPPGIAVSRTAVYLYGALWVVVAVGFGTLFAYLNRRFGIVEGPDDA